MAREVPGFAPTSELARALHAAGLPLAIASGSSPEGIHIALRAIGLDAIFLCRSPPCTSLTASPLLMSSWPPPRNWESTLRTAW
ncbi:MAG: hypothetical protein ACOYEV_12975 [Candidatus Nanopelagicales bacterium]